MDAQLFQEVCDAIQNHNSRIKIPLNNSCPIGRVLWSTFDFMSGPVLKFVWEADCQNPPSGDSGDETVDGNVSTDSSVSKNTNGSDVTMAKNQYEEIDEIFKNELISAAVDDEDLFAGFNNFTNFGAKESLRPTTSTDTSSSFTLVNQRNSTTDGQSSSKWTTTFDTPVAQDAIQNDNDSADCANSRQQQQEQQQQQSEQITTEETLCQDESAVMTESCVDSGIAATTSMESDLSSRCSTTNPQDRPSISASQHQRRRKGRADVDAHPIRYRVGSEDCNIHMDYVKRPQVKQQQSTQRPMTQNIGYCEEAIEEDSEEICRVRAALSRMARMSDDDPTDASFTTSEMLNASSLADEELFDESQGSAARRNSVEAVQEAFYREAEMLTTLNAVGGSDCGVSTLSDEEFIAQFALAEQICSPPQLSSPLLHKLTTIPARRIVVGSYIFVLKRDGSTQTSAISVILPLHLMNWYTKRQEVVEEFMTDTISRFKAAYSVESVDDAVCRLTREFIALFEMFSALERWPLAAPKLQLIKATHLWSKQRLGPVELNFVGKAITACLMTKGMCTVVGADPTHLIRMMNTLCLFVDSKYRPFCLRPYRFPFSPYLRIQAVKRSELVDVYTAAADCHWPMAIIDVDRSSVTYSGAFVRHRSLKRRALQAQVGQILREAGVELDPLDERKCAKIVQIEPRVVCADASVVEFLELLALLPLKCSARYAHLDHFHLRVENRARALLQFVKDVSLPAPDDKRSAVTAPWNIGTARRALGLQSDPAFAIALTRADELTANFAEFFYQVACRQAKVNDHQYTHRF